MHLRSVFLLLVLVLALCAVALWQRSRETTPEMIGVRELVPGLKRDAILALRVDSLERGLQMRLEGTADGTWRLSDPLSYPADISLLSQLLDALTLHPAEPWEGEVGALGLRPPRAVLEVEERGDTGVRLHRIEMGAVDVDRQHVFLRVDGELVRATSALNTLLELPLPEWREHAILPELSPRLLVTLSRAGKVLLPLVGAADLALEAERDERWKTSAPQVAALGPEAFGTLLSELCSLRAAGFEDDAPGPLEHYGLEPPDFRIEVATVRGESFAVRFAQRPGRERLLCVREGLPHVFSVAPESMSWLMTPFEALVDRELARVPRERVSRMRLLADGRETVLERAGFGWRVSARGGASPPLPPQPADGQRVSDLLAGIEKTRVVEVLPGIEFAPAQAAQGVYLEVDGEVRGGEIGAPHASSRGTQGLLFRREGDTLVGLVEGDLLELLRTDPRSLRSDELHKVAELDVLQAKVAAAWAQVQRTWGRDERGRWIPEGSTGEARDFARIVDQLLVARARRLLEPGEEVEGIQPLAVALLDRAGRTITAFSLHLVAGSAADPQAAEVLYLSSEARAMVDGRLYFALRALLGLP